MITKSILSTAYIFFITLLVMACNSPRTLYLSNKTNRSITLMIDEDSVFDGQRLAEIFKDSLHGKRIESGHSIINFGKGGWNKNDIESLKSVLAKTTVQIDGKDASYRARSNMHVAHHRLFVEELLVRIREQ